MTRPVVRGTRAGLPASTRLSRRERERRAAGGGGSRSAPLPLLLPALVGIAFLAVPLAALLLRAPWEDAWQILRGSQAEEALKLSLWTSTVATGISFVVGVPLAWVLARTDFTGLRVVRALVTLPLVLPPVVGGVALLLAFGRNGFKRHAGRVGFLEKLTYCLRAVLETWIRAPQTKTNPYHSVSSLEPTFKALDIRNHFQR